MPPLMLWIDLETTGLDETVDSIIEVGAIVTTPELEPLAEFTTLVRPEPSALARLLNDPHLVKMHTDNGLLADLDVGPALTHDPAATALRDELPDIGTVEGRLIHWLTGFEPAGPVTLAGSGVSHFDRRFIGAHMPLLQVLLAHTPSDVGICRRDYLRATGLNLVDVNDRKPHRAMDDIRLHLAEGQAFRDAFRTIAAIDHRHRIAAP